MTFSRLTARLMVLTVLVTATTGCADNFAPTAGIEPPDSLVAKALGIRLVSVRWARRSGAAGYLVERRSNLAGEFTSIKQITSGEIVSYTDDQVEPETIYGYRMRALATTGVASEPGLVTGVRTPPLPAIEIETSTDGGAFTDPDGYTATVTATGRDTVRRPMAVTDEQRVGPLPSGTYLVSLTGVATNCAVAGGDLERQVTLTEEGVETVRGASFAVSCRNPNVGRVRVTVNSSGDSLDADGYTVTLSGIADDQTLPSSERAYLKSISDPRVNLATAFEDLHPGGYTLEIFGLAGNCTVTGAASREFRVEKLDDRLENFAINCPIPDDPTKPLVYEATWSVATAPAGQAVYQDIGLDLTGKPGEDLKAFQGAFTYDAAVVRIDSVIKQGTWIITPNTGTAGKVLWNALVNGPGIQGRFVMARFWYTVIGAANSTANTTASFDPNGADRIVVTNRAGQSLIPLLRRREGTLTVSTGGGGPVNQNPSANPGGPYTGTAGTAVNVSGTSSSDPDGTIQSYSWTFGDGGSATGPTASHTYSSQGTYTMTLTVTDNGGATNSASTTATISGGGGGNQNPTARPGGPYSGSAGVALALDGSTSSDPDGSIASYSWSFGDGGTANVQQPSHSYVAAGTYTVSLTVTDNLGGTNTASTTATITGGGGGSTPLTWAGTFGAIGAADSLVTLTITLDLTSDLSQTTGPEALQDWAVDSLKWDPTVLKYFSFNFGTGWTGSNNPTAALAGKLVVQGTHTYSATQPAPNSTGVVTIANIKFKVIGNPGTSTTTVTALHSLVGPVPTTFSYRSFTAIQEATLVAP